MTQEESSITSTIAKAFDDYYRNYDEENDTKKQKKSVAEEQDIIKEEDVLNADEALAIALAAVDYYIYKGVDDVLSDDGDRTHFVQNIHKKAKAFKAQYGAAEFDANAIAAEFMKLAGDN